MPYDCCSSRSERARSRLILTIFLVELNVLFVLVVIQTALYVFTELKQRLFLKKQEIL